MIPPGRVDCRADGKRLLLVEGVNDCHAVSQLYRLVRGSAPPFGIRECGSDDGVLDELASRLISSLAGQEVLGLILDADLDGVEPERVVRSRLDQLRTRVADRYLLPDQFPAQGLVVEPERNRPGGGRLPRLGVWLMPDNRAWGMFEDLLRDSLPVAISEYTTRVVQQARADRIAECRETHLSKSVIRTYMAWQDPPDIQYLGLAIQRGVFENIEPRCQGLLAWLDALFRVA